MVNEDLVKAMAYYKQTKDYESWLGCLSLIYPEDTKRFYKDVLEYRKTVQTLAMNRVDIADNLDRVKRSYQLTAKEVFDDYMIFLEWDRDNDKKFWLPRRKVLLPVCQALQDLEDDKLDILGISLPPGTGKTTIKIFYLTWILGKYPDKPNLDSGHSEMMTRSTYDGVMSILSDSYEYLWHDVFPTTPKIITNAKELTIDIGKKHRFSTLTCRAIGGSLTGATRSEKILSADDLISGIEEAMSMDRLNKKWDLFTNNLLSRCKLGAKQLHIMTRWSVHDPVGRLERMYEGNDRARFIVIPALDEEGHSNFNYDYGVGFDDKFFENIKASMDDISFRALYQNQPIEREGLLYFPDDLRRYYELPQGEPDMILAVCDVADNGSDDTVLPIFAVYGNDHYMIDCVCSDALPEVTNALITEKILEHKVQRCQFESNSMGFRACDTVQSMVKARNGRCSFTKKNTNGNKETKIIVNSDWVKSHCIFKDDSVIKKGSMYWWFIQKLCSYTQTGKNKHDDVPDALAQYSLYMDTFNSGHVTVMRRFF